ncbi:hypothetical protein B0H66DRAFT_322101 [Apodospora peruviana]|uniref:Uncharacterized protein n=1 Tax=Apodospora peruviana TaxID=516989 RepID=A0AAE0HXN6_9PEZI|nr:hypothetical protein B0H66DRAFT_322101 [Apodospora peruviana]
MAEARYRYEDEMRMREKMISALTERNEHMLREYRQNSTGYGPPAERKDEQDRVESLQKLLEPVVVVGKRRMSFGEDEEVVVVVGDNQDDGSDGIGPEQGVALGFNRRAWIDVVLSPSSSPPKSSSNLSPRATKIAKLDHQGGTFKQMLSRVVGLPSSSPQASPQLSPRSSPIAANCPSVGQALAAFKILGTSDSRTTRGDSDDTNMCLDSLEEGQQPINIIHDMDSKNNVASTNADNISIDGNNVGKIDSSGDEKPKKNTNCQQNCTERAQLVQREAGSVEDLLREIVRALQGFKNRCEYTMKQLQDYGGKTSNLAFEAMFLRKQLVEVILRLHDSVLWASNAACTICYNNVIHGEPVEHQGHSDTKLTKIFDLAERFALTERAVKLAAEKRPLAGAYTRGERHPRRRNEHWQVLLPPLESDEETSAASRSDSSGRMSMCSRSPSSRDESLQPSSRNGSDDK